MFICQRYLTGFQVYLFKNKREHTSESGQFSYNWINEVELWNKHENGKLKVYPISETRGIIPVVSAVVGVGDDVCMEI